MNKMKKDTPDESRRKMIGLKHEKNSKIACDYGKKDNKLLLTELTLISSILKIIKCNLICWTLS